MYNRPVNYRSPTVTENERFIFWMNAFSIKLQQLFVIDHNSSPSTTHIADILRITKIQLQLELEMPKLVTVMPNDNYIYRLQSQNGMTALRERLITAKQAATMPNDNYLYRLFTDNGMKALREKLITPEQVAAMPSDNHLYYLFSDNGLTALREGLITREQVSAYSDPNIFHWMFSDKGMQELREKQNESYRSYHCW